MRPALQSFPQRFLPVIVATFALAPPACGRRTAGGRRAELRKPGVVEVSDQMRPFVRTGRVGESPSGRRAEVTFSGKVAFNEGHLHYAPIGSPVTGRVVRLMVEAGDSVRQEEALLAIFSPDLAGAQSARQGARTERGRASARLSRAARLVDAGAGSESDLEDARSAYARAQQEEARATAALGSLGGALGGAELVLASPIAGTVVSRHAGPGSVVRPGADGPVVLVAALSKIWVYADVPESDLGEVHLGQQATVTVQASARTFPGVVTRIANQVDADTHTLRVRVDVDNEVDPAGSGGGIVSYLLKPGMYATISMDTLSTSRVVIPLSAVLTRRDEFFVFVRSDDGKFRERRVRLGATIRGDEVALVQEPAGPRIELGDEIVVEGSILLDAQANEPLATAATDAGSELATGGAHP